MPDEAGKAPAAKKRGPPKGRSREMTQKDPFRHTNRAIKMIERLGAQFDKTAERLEKMRGSIRREIEIMATKTNVDERAAGAGAGGGTSQASTVEAGAGSSVEASQSRAAQTAAGTQSEIGMDIGGDEAQQAHIVAHSGANFANMKRIVGIEFNLDAFLASHAMRLTTISERLANNGAALDNLVNNNAASHAKDMDVLVHSEQTRTVRIGDKTNTIDIELLTAMAKAGLLKLPS